MGYFQLSDRRLRILIGTTRSIEHARKHSTLTSRIQAHWHQDSSIATAGIQARAHHYSSTLTAQPASPASPAQPAPPVTVQHTGHGTAESRCNASGAGQAHVTVFKHTSMAEYSSTQPWQSTQALNHGLYASTYMQAQIHGTVCKHTAMALYSTTRPQP